MGLGSAAHRRRGAALRPGHEKFYAAFASPNASASSEYDFFRAS
jgi:hypothetical protein